MSGILVIKLGALGDFVQATGSFEAIRLHHPNARLTLLTTPPFVPLARAQGRFDEIWEEGRQRSLLEQINLIRRLRRARFDRVYDLQTSQRSSLLFQMLRPRPPEWSGIAPGCSHPHANRARDFLHTLERQAEQLVMAGVPADAAPADLSVLGRGEGARATRFGVKEPYALLVPGGSAHRPGKRWPAEDFAALAAHFAEQGLTPVVIGGPPEAAIAQTILAAAPAARNLVGETDFIDILALAARARLGVGNDTGPMHLIAAAGTPSLILFGPASDPALCAPRGENVQILRAQPLVALDLGQVVSAVGGALR